jgi:SAM-dependent methyltransferase
MRADFSRALTGGYGAMMAWGLNARAARECPLCGWTGFQFLPTKPGPFLRFDARCPSCGSCERHRLAYLLLKDLLPERLGRVLHFAPEPAISRWIEPIADVYETADLVREGVTHKLDIQAMPFENDRFDFIWCSHILEHVPDDAAAMSELRRVLCKGGIAIVQIPVWGERTLDGPLDRQEDRLQLYFQEDHVRRYGRDVVDRMRGAGFDVQVRLPDHLPLQTVLRHALASASTCEVFVLT